MQIQPISGNSVAMEALSKLVSPQPEQKISTEAAKPKVRVRVAQLQDDPWNPRQRVEELRGDYAQHRMTGLGPSPAESVMRERQVLQNWQNNFKPYLNWRAKWVGSAQAPGELSKAFADSGYNIEQLLLAAPKFQDLWQKLKQGMAQAVQKGTVNVTPGELAERALSDFQQSFLAERDLILGQMQDIAEGKKPRANALEWNWEETAEESEEDPFGKMELPEDPFAAFSATKAFLRRWAKKGTLAQSHG